MINTTIGTTNNCVIDRKADFASSESRNCAEGDVAEFKLRYRSVDGNTTDSQTIFLLPEVITELKKQLKKQQKIFVLSRTFKMPGTC